MEGSWNLKMTEARGVLFRLFRPDVVFLLGIVLMFK